VKSLPAPDFAPAPAPIDPAPASLSAIDNESRPGNQHRPGVIWLCLHFPQLVLDTFEQSQGIPLVIIEQQRNGHFVHSACEIALAEGIMPGMPLNAAYTLSHNLSARLRDTKQEKKVLRQLAWRATGFTSAISLAPPDSLLLEVSASLRLFGGLEALRAQIVSAFSVDPVARSAVISPVVISPAVISPVVISIASTPAAALLLAGNGLERVVLHKAGLKSVLGHLRIEHCRIEHCGIGHSGIEPALARNLAKCGLYLLRDLWRLPGQDLARRFGPDLITFLNRLCGDQPDPRPMHTPTIRFDDQLELPVQSVDRQVLQAAAGKLLERARDFLQSRNAVTESVRFQLCHIEQKNRSRSRTDVVIRLQQPDRQPQRFLPQLVERLGQLQLPAPVDRVILRIEQVIPWCGQNRDLFHSREADRQDWMQLLTVLAARLGERMVYTVHEVPDHRPEKAWRADSAEQTITSKPDAKARPETSASESLPPRPTWLLPVPKSLGPSLSESAPPESILPGSIFSGEVERIEAGWWDHGDCRRDYRTVTTGNGSRWWIFHDLGRADLGQADLDQDGPDRRNIRQDAHIKGPLQWYLHGLFA